MNIPERVLIDSNVLYSAARDPANSFRTLWSMPEVEVLVSPYILDEVSRHLSRPDLRAELWTLMYNVHLVPSGEEIDLPATVSLPAKDRPILQSAIAGRATVLLTGDKVHFGALFGSSISGVRIESTRMFKNRYPQYFGSGR